MRLPNFGHFAFLSPPGGLGTTYDVHIELIAKGVVHFLLVLIELDFFSLGVTAESIRAKIDRKSTIALQFDPKLQVEGVAPATNHFCTDS